MNETKRLTPLYGIGVFIFEMILFVLVAPPVQSKLGIAGVAITELMLLAIVNIFSIILFYDFKLPLCMGQCHSFTVHLLYDDITHFLRH